jgi:hypothetical protein
MSWQIIKNLKAENGKISCEMRSNNVWPHDYYKWECEDTPETRAKVGQFLLEGSWQPIRETGFIKQLKSIN